MYGELMPNTEPGRRFVALAEEHAADFTTRADQHDREGSFPFENIESLQKSGFMAATVPEEFGGIGLASGHDHMVGMSRLARGCASTAIASNMHLVSARTMARIWEQRDHADPGVVAATSAFLKAIGAGQLIACVPGTEAGTDISSPMAEVTPVEGGYVLNGRKMFGTLSPAAQIVFSMARLKRDDGGYQRVLAVIPRGTPGMEILDNWDALGMRASGSGDVVYSDCKLPAASVVPVGEWGVLGGNGGPLDTMNQAGTLTACFLGIAEEAQRIAIEMAGRRKGPRGIRMADRSGIQQLIAENEIDLFVARAALERGGRALDEAGAADTVSAEADAENMKEGQCMKRAVEGNAIRIVDRAMAISGGAGYMSKHPLSRLYRDVRAGPFMQPFGAYEVLEYIGKVTLGIDPPLDR
jgi:alkylation response protein AidB-like acyl-CoA dehydrogenase